MAPDLHIGPKSIAEIMEVVEEDVSVVAAAEADQEAPTPAEEEEPAAEVKPEGDSMTKMNIMNTPKRIAEKMTMTKRKAYSSPRWMTIIITIMILESIIVATYFVPPADKLLVDVIPSQPDATT